MTCIPLYTTSKRTHLFRCHLSIHLPSCYRWDGGWDRDIGTQNVPFFSTPFTVSRRDIKIHGVWKFVQYLVIGPIQVSFFLNLLDRGETRAEVGVGLALKNYEFYRTLHYMTPPMIYTLKGEVGAWYLNIIQHHLSRCRLFIHLPVKSEVGTEIL